LAVAVTDLQFIIDLVLGILLNLLKCLTIYDL